ncbi:FCD domain protein [compost metagenome]
MAETLARLHAHMHVFRLCFRTSVTEQAREEHNLIISALVNGDAQTATDAMREHILKSWERMSTLLSDFN